MADDLQIRQLVEEILDSKRTPEEVCSDTPDLLPAVRRRLEQVQRIGEQLDEMFGNDDPTKHGHVQLLNGQIVLPIINGYEIQSILGRGGMGVVFKARQQELNRTVALKMLLAGVYASQEESARFRCEARALAALKHPNIVQVHDAGEVDGRSYFTMEYVEGGTLAQNMAAKPLPPQRAAAMVANLASAMQFAHKSGFIHRDIKPVNILLTADGTPKITDFGLARYIHRDREFTLSGATLGTPAYMAPEQASAKVGAVGPAADIYALGAILYEMLTGRPPLEGQSPAETIQKVMSEEPVPPARLNAKVPRDLETICLKCLQKNPARRYSSAQDLSDDLHRFLDDKPVLARPIGLFERAAKWVRRRPAAALLIAAILMTSTAAIGTGVWLQQQEADRRAAKELREGQSREAAETVLRRADDLRQEKRWKEALQVVTDALPHLVQANSPPLEDRLKRAQSDFRIAVELESTLESNPLTPRLEPDYPARATEYQQTFARIGLRIDDAEEVVADYVRTSMVRDQLLAAIDDRAFVAFMLNDGPLTERLLRIARLADPGSPWRQQFRDTKVWANRAQLQELTATAFTTVPPPSDHQFALLGLLLRKAGAHGQASDVLREACRRQPRNFWVHREMGAALVAQALSWEAIAFFRAARALRPDNAYIHERLGWCLFEAGRIDDGLAAFRRATELSDHLSFRVSYVIDMARSGYWKDAEAVCSRTQGIDGNGFHPYYAFALVLVNHERYEDAVVMFRRSIEKGVDNARAFHVFADYLMRMGRHEEAIIQFEKVTKLDPTQLHAPQMLARELSAVGRWDEAIGLLQAAANRAPNYFWYSIELGHILRSRGKPEEAVKAFRTVVTRFPQVPDGWKGLADSLLDQGHFTDARAAIASHLALPNSEASRRALAISDAQRLALRRQLDLCNAMLTIELQLPAILAGTERPADIRTQRAAAEWCLNHKRLTARAAALYASALAAEPALADDTEAANRLNAARAAALAGCGIGADAGKLDDRRRADLRKQAFDWLTAEYKVWAERHRAGKSEDRTCAASAVRDWLNGDVETNRQSSPVSEAHERIRLSEDLACVRNEKALAMLPAAERRDWQELWAKVAALAARDPVELLTRARAHVARMEWAQAAMCYAERLEFEPMDSAEVWYEYAAAQLLTEDRAGYQRTCAHMKARRQPMGPMRPYLVARAATLAPDAFDDPAQSLEALKKFDGNSVEFWAYTEQAALHVRMNQPGKAVWQAESSMVVDGTPGRAVLNWLWLSLAHQKMGNFNESRRWLNKADNWLDQQDGRMPLDHPCLRLHLHNWLEAHVLRREVEALLTKGHKSDR